MNIMQLTLFIMSLGSNSCKVESLQSPALCGAQNSLTVHKQPSGCLENENTHHPRIPLAWFGREGEVQGAGEVIKCTTRVSWPYKMAINHKLFRSKQVISYLVHQLSACNDMIIFYFPLKSMAATNSNQSPRNQSENKSYGSQTSAGFTAKQSCLPISCITFNEHVRVCACVWLCRVNCSPLPEQKVLMTLHTDMVICSNMPCGVNTRQVADK